MPSNEYDGGREFGSISVAEIYGVTNSRFQKSVAIPRHVVRLSCARTCGTPKSLRTRR